MSMFNQIKMAQDMMKNMSPEEMKDLMEKAQQQKQMLDGQIEKAVKEEIEKRDLVSREEVETLIKKLT